MSTSRSKLPDFDVEFVDVPPRTVLVVDDSALWRKVIIEQVLAFDARTIVLEADTGRDALDKLTRLDIDVVFLDLALPEINGDGIVRSVAASRRMPFFVVVSGVVTRDDVQELRRLLAYDVIEKPIAPGAITRVLKSYDYATRHRSLLIVDDSRTTCALVRRVVARSVFRFSVDDTTNGVSAVELYAKTRHDILMIDLNMPGLNGADLLRVFRACYPGFRAIMMSSSRAQLAQLDDATIIGRLAKPFSPAELDTILHGAFNLPLPYAALSRG